MKWYRLPLGVLGAVLGPILGLSYAAFMRLANADKHMDQVTMKPHVVTLDKPLRLVRVARCVPTGRAAVTIGRHVYTRKRLISSGLFWHEAVHVEQFQRWGMIPFFVRYGWDIGMNSYAHSVLEDEARSRSGHA